MHKLRHLAVALTLILAGCASTPRPAANKTTGELKIATWDLEFLAEHDGAGCQPRKTADYVEMRRIAESLNADVIAFQEVENRAAAARVFDPSRYKIVMETRPGNPGGTCGSTGPAAGQTFIPQAVGFAIGKGVAFSRAADVASLQLGNPNLRSGVDITVTPANGRPLRLLTVHLKSGCASESSGDACATLTQQIPKLERWIVAAATGPTRFAVLGDWNGRLAQPGYTVWPPLDDGVPASSNLTLTDQGIPPKCDERYRDFINHIVLDNRASADFKAFAKTIYATKYHASDHCPVSVVLAR